MLALIASWHQYCPIWNRIAQCASLVLGIPHVPIVTIAGFGGFHKILSEFIAPEGASIDDFRDLYRSSETNRAAIAELCSPPFNLEAKIFDEGAPVYYFGREPTCAPYGRTLGKHGLVTTIPSLRDKIFDSFEEEEELYMKTCGVKLVSILPLCSCHVNSALMPDAFYRISIMLVQWLVTLDCSAHRHTKQCGQSKSSSS